MSLEPKRGHFDRKPGYFVQGRIAQITVRSSSDDNSLMWLYRDLHLVVGKGLSSSRLGRGPQSCRSARTRETPAVLGVGRPAELIRYTSGSSPR